MVDQYGDSYIIHHPLNIVVPKLSESELEDLRNGFDWGDLKPWIYLFKGLSFYVCGNNLSARFLRKELRDSVETCRNILSNVAT